MISVLIHKATRGTRVVQAGLTIEKARELGNEVYQGWKHIHRSFPELTLSGVSVMLVADENVPGIIEDLRSPDKRIIESYGCA